MLKRKGFLGPIGDDLPSLIPLLFALMIFFSAYTFALNEFTSENQEIDNKLEVLRVSRVLRTDGLIDGFDDFNRLCNIIPLTSVKFKAGLINAQENPSMRLRDEADVINDTETDKRFLCISRGATVTELEEKEARRVYSLIYPIAVQQDKVVLPVHLVVVGWKD